LDFRLLRLGIRPDQIKGYQTEEFTHMSVAVAVLNGAADVGLGIYAAARALELDFIPVATEQYDLIIPKSYFKAPKLKTLLDTISTPIFKKRVEKLGGYNTKRTGMVLI